MSEVVNPKNALPLSGVFAAALMPLHEDLSCNYVEFVRHCKDLLAKGCRGVILCGTTGEGTSLTMEERESVIKEVAASGIDPQRTIVAISCCAIPDAVRLAALAVENKCAAVLIAPPFFYKDVHDEDVIAFYREVIKRAAHPCLKVLLYHIPMYSGVPITVNIIKTLLKEFPDTVIGIKESAGNLLFIKEVLSKFPDFKVFAGNELQISEAVQLGAAGAISGIANAYPELICSLYAFGKDPKSPHKDGAIRHIMKSFKNYPIFSAIKSTVEKQKGSAWHVMRPPLSPLNKKQQQSLAEELAKAPSEDL